VAAVGPRNRERFEGTGEVERCHSIERDEANQPQRRLARSYLGEVGHGVAPRRTRLIGAACSKTVLIHGKATTAAKTAHENGLFLVPQSRHVGATVSFASGASLRESYSMWQKSEIVGFGGA
jgi:hypothetical protein